MLPTTKRRIIEFWGCLERVTFLSTSFFQAHKIRTGRCIGTMAPPTIFFVAFDGSSTFQFSAGHAFWIINKGPVNINTTVPSAPLNAAQEVVISLQSGWNLITNPFTSAIAWSNIQAADTLSEPIYSFNGSFSESSTFDPYVGYYFFNATNRSSLSWEFEVRTIQREASQLAFSGISKIPSQFEVYLIDKGRARTVNLREDSLYRFTPAAELSKFSVVVGKNEAVQEKLSSVALPKAFALGPNYPNPFNPTTTIPVAVPVTSEVKLKIYNLLGAEVKTIYDGAIDAGRYWFNWDGRNEAGNNVATGVYLYRLTTSTGVTLLGKMILIR